MSRKNRPVQVSNSSKTKILPDTSDPKVKMVLVFLYLAADFIPGFGAIDVMGSQWLYYATLNVLAAIYIAYNFRNRLASLLNKFSKNLLILTYLSVIGLCAISFLNALNPVESVVVYSRYIITFIAFFNLAVLLYDEPDSIGYLFQAIAFVAIVQCTPLLITFLKDIKTVSTDVAVSRMLGLAGNKNVLAAALVIKVPAIIYSLLQSKSFWKYCVNLLALFITITTIIVLNARAAYLGLFVQLLILLIFLLLRIREQRSWKIAFKPLMLVMIPFFVGLGVSQTMIAAGQKVDGSGQYTTIGKRLATLTDHKQSSGAARLFFWQNGLKLIKERPLLGGGIGNWKILSVKYENTFYDDFNYSKHAHNDFIQLATEAGIPAAILYLSLFAIAGGYAIVVLRAMTSPIVRLVMVSSFMALAGYAIDAGFNFPVERPVMQAYFAIYLAILVGSYCSNGQKLVGGTASPVFRAVFLGVIFCISAVAIYVSYQVYMSMRVQRYTHFNFGTANQGVTWQDVNPKFPEIPNLAENNIPINDTKAWYLFRAQRYDEALSLLNQDKNANPYSMSKEWLKSSIYTAQGKIDSAHFYAKKGFFQRPRNLSLYNLVTRTSVPLKDTATIQSAFRLYNKYRDEPATWRIYMRSLFAVNYNRPELIRKADSIARVYPDIPEIQHTKYFIRAGNAATSKRYEEALNNLLQIVKIYPNDAETLENIGITYYYLRDYPNAAVYFKKVIDAKAYQNGKSEFFIGNCLLQLGRKGEACGYLSIAANRNYPMAAIVFNKNNCEFNTAQ